MIKAMNPQCVRVVEGRCWLLIASDISSVSYFDLDAFPSTENVLIPDKHDATSLNMLMCTHMTIDVDGNPAFLAFNFNLALYPKYAI